MPDRRGAGAARPCDAMLPHAACHAGRGTPSEYPHIAAESRAAHKIKYRLIIVCLGKLYELYAGKIIVPDEPLDLRPNKALVVRIESIGGETGRRNRVDLNVAVVFADTSFRIALSSRRDEYSGGGSTDLLERPFFLSPVRIHLHAIKISG